jgi:hypothetical protein
MFILKYINYINYMNQKWAEDFKFGLDQEISIQSTLEKVFGKLYKTSQHSPFDFQNEKFIIEIKSRRIAHDKYGSQIFGQNKLRAGWDELRGGRQPIFVFNCKDGVFYWSQKQGEFTLGDGGRYDRGKSEPQKLVYIKTKFLGKLS